MKLLLGILLGIFIANIPDLTALYIDHTINGYHERICKAKGLKGQDCKFDMYYDKFTEEHPDMAKIGYYFQLGEGPAYWVLSGRCSNQISYTPSAGKIVAREYFWSRCSTFMKDASDLIYRDGDK